MKVRTVLGDIEPGELGFCNAHDHLFFRSAVLPGEELDDVQAADAELCAYAESGGRSLAQWTPAGLGRRRPDLAALSRATGVKIIAATGRHQAMHHGDAADGDLSARFVADLTAPIPAGFIKIAGEFCAAGDPVVFEAAAAAHHATNAPIAVHLELGTGGEAVLHELIDAYGVPPSSLILGHLGRNPDVREHRRLAESGAFLAFDGPSRRHHASDWRLVDSLAALVDSGHGGQLLLGMDTALMSMRGAPGMPYLGRNLRPLLAREIGRSVADAIFVANPARAFAAAWSGDLSDA